MRPHPDDTAWESVKPDTRRNSPGVADRVLRQREREKRLVPLRIDRATVIYVTKDKQTPEYAEEYRRRMSAAPARRW